MFACRSRQLEPEIMDGAGLDPAAHRQALAALHRINVLSGAANAVFAAVRRIAPDPAGRSLRVLDLATGGGDVPIGLWRRCHKRGALVEVAGCDRSAVAVAHARDAAARRAVPVHFFEWDVETSGIPEGYDIVTCSLFLHHLTDAAAGDMLRAMAAAARCGIVVNDLERCWAGLALAHVATRALTRSPIVHNDGPQSVRAAFSLQEAKQLAAQAGLVGARVCRAWPLRFVLSWSRAA